MTCQQNEVRLLYTILGFHHEGEETPLAAFLPLHLPPPPLPSSTPPPHPGNPHHSLSRTPWPPGSRLRDTQQCPTPPLYHIHVISGRGWGGIEKTIVSRHLENWRKEGGNVTCWVRECRLVQYTSVVIVVQQVNLQQRHPNSWSPHLLLAYLVVMTKPLSPAQELDLLCLPTPSSQSSSSEPPTLGGSQMVSNDSVDASLDAYLVFHAVYHWSSLRHSQQL